MATSNLHAAEVPLFATTLFCNTKAEEIKAGIQKKPFCLMSLVEKRIGAYFRSK